MTHDLHRLLNWKLLKGSHKFPGEDGGTCINEAAVVVAGLEYRSISNAHSCPPCFSIPIASYAINLNDRMPNSLRQKLLIPFVTRLAGTADTPNIEKQRIKLIVDRTITDILPIGLRQSGLATNAAKAADAADFADAAAVYAAAAADAAAAATADDYVKAASYAAAAADNVDYATYAADIIENRNFVWTTAVAILDAALLIGRQAEPIEVETVLARVEAAKKRSSLLSQV